jgi:hypothetical protein
MLLVQAFAFAATIAQAVALVVGGKQMIVERGSDSLQDIVRSPFSYPSILFSLSWLLPDDWVIDR